MIIKKLKFNDYKIIKNFIIKNHSKLPNIESLKLLDKITKNKSCLNFDGLYFKDKLIGYHSIIEKKIIYKKKKFKILISSNWNVSEKFRNYSLTLINKYLKTKCDFYCTTTANENVSKIWRSFGALEINNLSSRVTFFKVTNYQNLLNYYLKKRKIKILPNFLTFIISKIIKLIYFKKNSLLRKNKFTYKKIAKNSLLLEKFNKIYEAKSSYPLEQRSNFILLRYLEILETNKKNLFIYQILLKNKMIGYMVLVGENHNGLKRLFLGEFKIENKYKLFINHIISFATNVAIVNNYSLIYFKNFQTNIFKHVNLNKFFVIRQNFNSYLIKIGSKKAKKLKSFFKYQWGTTYFDGDCLL